MKYLIGAATAALVIASATSALAAQATASVTANATVVTPLTASATAELQFGKLVMNASGASGTVVVAAATGNRTSTAGVDLVGGTGGAGGQAAVVHVVGDTVNGGSSPYTVTIPATANLSSGGNSMTVSGLNSNTASLTTLTGTNDIKIGGTLTAQANQAAGVYSGTFDVTAAYN